MNTLRHLAQIRRFRGISQAALGRRAGLGQSYISALERGLQPSDPRHVVRIAAELGVEPEALTAAEMTICTSPSCVVSVYAGARP
jgi:transcriptional regulator with XRE-family HTH domain